MKRLIAVLLAAALILSLFSGCSLIRKMAPEKDGSDPAPANAEEILRRIAQDVENVFDSEKLSSVSSRIRGETDPDLLKNLWEEAYGCFRELEQQGKITNLTADSSDLSFQYQIDNFPFVYSVSSADQTLSGTGCGGAVQTLSALPLMNPASRKPDLSGDPIYKALVLSWDNVPFERRSIEDIKNSTQATHWDIAQYYAHLFETAKNVNVTVDRADDFTISDLTEEKLGSYDFLLFNTHGKLIDGSPYMSTAEIYSNKVKESIKYVIWKGSTPYFKTGVKVNYDPNLAQFLTGYYGHYMVGGPYFGEYFSENSLKARWIYIGACWGMAGDNSLAEALHHAGADLITGNDNEEYKNINYKRLGTMIPDFLNWKNLETVMEDITWKGTDVIRHPLANPVSLPNTGSILNEGLFCGIRLSVETDYYYPGETWNDRVSLFVKDADQYRYVREKALYLHTGEEMIFTGLEEGKEYLARIEASNYQTQELRFTADYRMTRYDVTLIYDGGEPGSLLTPDGMNAVQVFVTDDADPPKALPGTSVEIYGKTDESSDYTLLFRTETDVEGEFLDYVPDRYKIIRAEVRRDGYKVQYAESADFKDGYFWQHTFRMQKGDPGEETPESQSSEEPSGTPSGASESHEEAVYYLLEYLAEQYGVMPIGSEYFESDVATKPLRGQNQGLLFADDYDYDHDGENEVLILRNDPSLAENRASTDHLILEMYEYVNGRFESSDSREFIAYGLTSTYSNHSFSVFRYDSWNEYGGGTYIALELYGQMNSQNTSVVALYYDGSGLIFVDGGNYGEWDGSDDMKSSFAVPATAENGFILDRNAEGFEHWTDWASSGIPMDEYVIEEFRYKLNALGLDLRILRSIYSDYNGTEGVARNAAYCGLIASDCYVPYEEYTSTELAMLGAISTEYAQAMQTLTRRDFTGLLDLFR